MFNHQKYPYPKMQSSDAQQGAVLIVVLLFLVLIILGGVIAVKNSTADRPIRFKFSTNIPIFLYKLTRFYILIHWV